MILEVTPYLPELPPVPLLIVELATAAIVASAFFAAHFPLQEILHRAAAKFAALAARPRLSMALAAVPPILLRVALLPWFGIPIPQAHDEFSHLLLADTLLHGRLANPPHPMHKYLQTMYVLQSPTYSSIYQPGNAAILALGKILTGTPWGGVCLEVGLLCAATYWMLCGRLDRTWALFGAIMTGLSVGVSGEWMNTYFGGALPAAGGALVFGACPRLIAKPTIHAGLLLGVGWSLVYFTRPYESVFLFLVAGLSIAGALWRRSRQGYSWPQHIPALVAAASLVAVTGAITLCHNRAVTGDAFCAPYQLAQKELGVPQGLIFQRIIPEPPGLPGNLHDMYEWQRSLRVRVGSPSGLARHSIRVVAAFCLFFIGLHLAPALWGLRGAWGRADVRMAAGFCLAAMVWSVPYPFFFARYQAACLCLAMYLVTLGAMRLSGSSPHGAPAGTALLSFVITATILAGMSAPIGRVLGLNNIIVDHSTRRDVEAAMLQKPGQHLIFVRYSRDHDLHNEWVWNGADIDGSRIIWAQEDGPDSIGNVKRYWPDRTIWAVYPDASPARLEEVAVKVDLQK